MACDLTTGRKKACFEVQGGIKTVYFSTDAMGAITYDVTDTDVVKTLAGTPEFFQYDLKGSANTYTETLTKDINNGTSFVAQSLAVQFTKLTKEMHKEIKLILYSSPTVIIQTKNDDYLMMGLINQADVTGGTILSGGGSGDLTGYTLVMTAEEAKPANFIFDAAPAIISIIEDTTASISAVQETP